MNTKLTLKLDKEIIELAKVYVKERGTSLSKFVEDILKTHVTKREQIEDEDLHPDLLEFVKLIRTGNDLKIDEDFDYKKAKAEYLIEKYGE
ncbi:MAG: DUF6364 family protein [Nonlabens sp.]